MGFNSGFKGLTGWVLLVATECIYWAVRTKFLFVILDEFQALKPSGQFQNQKPHENADALENLNDLEVSVCVSLISWRVSVSDRGGLDSQGICRSTCFRPVRIVTWKRCLVLRET